MNKELYLEAKKKTKESVYKAKSEAEKTRFTDILKRMKCFKMCIINDSILASSLEMLL